MSDKPRIRVPAGRQVISVGGQQGSRATAAYMRDTKSGVIAARPASLRQHRDEVRRVWTRAAALAMDMLQNSGRLRGVADQIIVDTVGVELSLNYQPDLTRFGYDSKEASDWVRMVKKAYRVWCWDPHECDIRGKWTIPQQTDIAMRHWLAFGESLGVMDYMGRGKRRQLGISTGTKYSVISPDRLVQDSNTGERLYQGVLHDEDGRPTGYRISTNNNGLTTKADYAARDRNGRQLVVHAFDPFSSEDVRGLSPLVPTFRKYLMGENTDDATAAMLFLQTIYAVTLTSDKPSADAFEALEVLKDAGGEGGDKIASDFVDYFSAQLDRAAESELRVGSEGQVNHLAPGEKLSFENISLPGANSAEFRADLNRETARALGVSYGGYTLDYTKATYASTNMEAASLYPVAVRRTDRLAAPHYLVPFQSWLDERIGEGFIPFKGGYEAFAANREALCWATCLGPSKPTADDEKRDRAVSERLLNGTSSLEDECAALGRDAEEVFESRTRWDKRYKDAGMVSPFERKMGSTPASDGKDNKQAAA